jgi:hypothetical protein
VCVCVRVGAVCCMYACASVGVSVVGCVVYVVCICGVSVVGCVLCIV